MNDRLQRFLAAENISQSQFADSIGVARASISHIISGRNKPGFDFIERTARCYPALNLDWLITGKGKMYRGNEPQTALEPLFSENDINNTEISGSYEGHNRDEKKVIDHIVVFFTDGTFQSFGSMF